MDDVADEEDHDDKGGNVGHPLSNTNRISYKLKTQEHVTMTVITVTLKILSFLHCCLTNFLPTSSRKSIMEYIIILRNANRELADIWIILRFFGLCQKSGIIPSGLSICLKLRNLEGMSKNYCLFVLNFVKVSFKYRRMFVILLNQSNL